MSEVEAAKIEEESANFMEKMCSDLFKEWLVDLTFEEKEIWLWNATVEMCKIKQRRPLARK